MKQERFIDLTEKERKKLRLLLLGYDNLCIAAVKCGLPCQQLQKINIAGYGETNMIKLVRRKLLLS
ncbi:MAG: hypothetical protein J0I41_13230 [Filimonas sp.]|nr:hypothetical protein [Filimonas sp.]